ncbi:MAG: ABC transporter ATP-binding protein [Candidatus Heimdallarchaeota archaeon]|nr:ABC transporter ATP-binding protein [Candidatus Heimdallarchaeota archaeon]MCK4955889.1 ABC transporter ATP-binding protein [Candidatus Heimdallarchaeota archaeon]
MLALETTQLTKDYETKDTFLRAVNDLTVAIEESEIYSLLGPNGSGKTTTVRMLAGILKPTLGSANVLGYDIVKESQQLRANVGLLTETPALYERLTVRQNLEFIAKLYDVPKEEIRHRVEEIVDLFDISEKIDLPSGSLSKGMKQKVAIARAIFHNPKVIFLDEPTSSLAPESAKIVRDQIIKLAKKEKRTFFICTHNLFEAERLSTRVGIINHGMLIAQGSPAVLREMKKDEAVTILRFVNWKPGIESFLKKLNVEIVDINPDQKTISVSISDIETQTPEIIKNLVNQKYQMIEVRHEYPTLERIYLELVETESAPRFDEEEDEQ